MDYSAISNYMKDIRKNYGYTQEYVADKLHIVRQTYSHYETGRITPPLNSLNNLARLYGIPLIDLIELIVIDYADEDYEI